MVEIHTQTGDRATSLSVTILRKPNAADGMTVNRLVSACPPLDVNSVYCNLLQCTHFADTCVVAESKAGLIGFTSAYLIPEHSETMFIWQIAVSKSARGQGLAKKMILELLRRPQCRQVSSLQTTIAPDNPASWQLFRSLAEELNAECTDSLIFDRKIHFEGNHPDERLLHLHSQSTPFSQHM
jgi:L-2,4-diaminobutyric acid acetyltransferase